MSQTSNHPVATDVKLSLGTLYKDFEQHKPGLIGSFNLLHQRANSLLQAKNPTKESLRSMLPKDLEINMSLTLNSIIEEVLSKNTETQKKVNIEQIIINAINYMFNKHVTTSIVFNFECT